jgi:hypothetical protein
LQNIFVDTLANVPKEHCHHTVCLNNNKVTALLYQYGEVGEQGLPNLVES